MKQYEVHFRWKNHNYKEVITTNHAHKARELVKGRYPGCVITSVRKL